MQLNEAQEAAVLDESRACLVRANVGSGKTTVLIEKIRHLHENRGVPYQKMAVMTFTRKAAGEIFERLGDIPEADHEKLYFGTFHAAASKLLRTALPEEPPYPEGIGASFTLIPPEEELELARVLIRKHGLKIRYPNRLAKRLEQDPQENEKDEMPRLRVLLAEEKRKSNRADYADLITTATGLWREGKGPSFDWVIIDEVQDCDGKQLEMIDALMKSSPDASLFAVGDPGQMIYGWRSKVTGIFRELERRYDARVLDLPQNYRSGVEILKAAKWFRQGGTPLKAARTDHSQITVRSHADPFSEAEYLASKIQKLHEEGTPYGEICILYRLREQAKVPEETFTRAGIPVVVHRGAGRTQNPAQIWFWRVVRACTDREDEISLALALEDPYYTGKYRDELEEKIRAARQEIPSDAQPRQIFDLIGPERYLHPTSVRFREDLEAVRLAAETAGPEQDEEETDVPDGDGVRLMTLHASKGLEFDHVFIIGVNDGLLPLAGTGDDEEKRLFYVGMTRARNSLEMSFYLNPGMPRVIPGEGRYLKMIPPELTIRDVPAGPAVSMKDLRLMVLEEKKRAAAGEISEKADAAAGKETAPAEREEQSGRRVLHERYGSGTVVFEDESVIRVLFDGYGEKEFIRAFAALSDEK